MMCNKMGSQKKNDAENAAQNKENLGNPWA